MHKGQSTHDQGQTLFAFRRIHALSVLISHPAAIEWMKGNQRPVQTHQKTHSCRQMFAADHVLITDQNQTCPLCAQSEGQNGASIYLHLTVSDCKRALSSLSLSCKITLLAAVL